MCQVLLLDNRANSGCIKNLFEVLFDCVCFQNPLISEFACGPGNGCMCVMFENLSRDWLLSVSWQEYAPVC